MYRTILVPLDGSSFCEHALPPALTLARRSGAALRLVVVYSRIVRPFPVPEAASYDTRFDVQQLRDREAYVEALVHRLGTEEGVAASGVVLDETDVPRALDAEARRADVDLMVMTTHGRGGISRAWMGSVADELVRLAPKPILLVRPTSATSPGAMAWSFGHVLVPLDGSPLSEAVLPHALEVARLTGARMSLLRVVRTPETLLPAEETFWTTAEREQLEAGRRAANEYLQTIAERLAADGVEPTLAVTLDAEPARAILAWGSAHDVDLIAISTHARAGLERLLIGSVTDKVVRGATVPTLVVRPEE
ncbi:MAG TPA: universal stress protein [Gemmatimonadaceae bacterium]|jgi:nucleotide-binding universal stress UspA family protein|nr:universal stress protein [Gemmatimonadaceae bacterium]